MTKACLRDNRPFGVCLIREGREVGEPAVPETVGCLATIEQWDMPQLGVFHIVGRGDQRFRLLETQVAKNGLISGTLARMEDPDGADAVDPACREVLKRVIEHLGPGKFPEPILLDDAGWVSYRLSEILPLEPRVKQELLEIETSEERLTRLRQLLVQQGLVA
jgi:Lon protease-like protein